MNEDKPVQEGKLANSAATPWWQRESFYKFISRNIVSALIVGLLVYSIVQSNQQYANLNHALLAANARIDMLAARLDTQAGRLDLFSDRLVAFSERLNDFAAQLNNLSVRLDDLSDEFALFRMNLQDLMDENEAHEEEHVLLDDRLDALTETN